MGLAAARRYVSVALSQGAATASRSTARYRELGRLRAAEVRAMSPSALAQVREAMGRADRLPKLGEHFRKHGAKFAELGVTTSGEYEQMFLAHLARDDTRVFTYISTTQPMAYRHWAIVGMDNGAIALYNESQGKHWSFFRTLALEDDLRRHRHWWVDATARLRELGGGGN